jgi:hypothetical protein
MAAPIVGEKIIGARNAWRSFQAALGILEHLGIGGAPACRFLRRGFAASILHLAAVEAHCRTVAPTRLFLPTFLLNAHIVA